MCSQSVVVTDSIGILLTYPLCLTFSCTETQCPAPQPFACGLSVATRALTAHCEAGQKSQGINIPGKVLNQ